MRREINLERTPMILPKVHKDSQLWPSRKRPSIIEISNRYGVVARGIVTIGHESGEGPKVECDGLDDRVRDKIEAAIEGGDESVRVDGVRYHWSIED
jgi:hypothetical protein